MTDNWVIQVYRASARRVASDGIETFARETRLFQANSSKTIEEPWVRMAPISIGAVPVGLGTPEWYVKVRRGDRPYLRVDLYLGPDEIDVFREVIIWEQFITIGVGHSVFLIDLESADSCGVELGSYFCRLYPSPGYLLVASAERLWRLNRDGSVKWTSQRIGIDGVEVLSVQDGIIKGHGQWDPPAGWKPFGVNLESGSRHGAFFRNKRRSEARLVRSQRTGFESRSDWDVGPERTHGCFDNGGCKTKPRS